MRVSQTYLYVHYTIVLKETRACHRREYRYIIRVAHICIHIRDISRISVSRWKIHVAEPTMKRKEEKQKVRLHFPLAVASSFLRGLSHRARRLALVLIINARLGQVAFLSNVTLSLCLHPPHLLFSYTTNPPVRGPYGPGSFARRVHYTLYVTVAVRIKHTRRVSRVASIKLQKFSLVTLISARY